MGLPWIRLDTSMFQNPKLLRLQAENKHRAVVLHLASMCWVGQQGMDGYVPEYILGLLQGRKQDAAELVEAGLWHKAIGGWDINDWNEFQISDEDAKKRSDHARTAALKRWHGNA